MQPADDTGRTWGDEVLALVPLDNSDPFRLRVLAARKAREVKPNIWRPGTNPIGHACPVDPPERKGESSRMAQKHIRDESYPMEIMRITLRYSGPDEDWEPMLGVNFETGDRFAFLDAHPVPRRVVRPATAMWETELGHPMVFMRPTPRRESVQRQLTHARATLVASSSLRYAWPTRTRSEMDVERRRGWCAVRDREVRGVGEAAGNQWQMPESER